MDSTTNVENIEAQIIEVAKQLFLEYGYKNTNMCDIASTVGINRTTLHYYFNTKDKMFEAVFGTIIKSFLPKIKDILLNNDTFFEKIDKIIDEYFRVFLTTPYLPSFIMGEINRDLKHLLSVAYSIDFANYLQILIKTITDEMDKGNIKRIPIHIIFMSFISQVTFPFIAKNLIQEILNSKDEELGKIIEEWKPIISMQMRNLLMVNG
ncbi:MAG: TetR/AcrR family transcriptional regulator [Bacteroidales bacterium]|jgi:AcrR family transcriptional regulator